MINRMGERRITVLSEHVWQANLSFHDYLSHHHPHTLSSNAAKLSRALTPRYHPTSPKFWLIARSITNQPAPKITQFDGRQNKSKKQKGNNQSGHGGKQFQNVPPLPLSLSCLWCKFDAHNEMHPKPERHAFCAVGKFGQRKKRTKETRRLCPSFPSIDVLIRDINQKAPDTPWNVVMNAWCFFGVVAVHRAQPWLS